MPILLSMSFNIIFEILALALSSHTCSFIYFSFRLFTRSRQQRYSLARPAIHSIFNTCCPIHSSPGASVFQFLTYPGSMQTYRSYEVGYGLD